MYVPLHVRLCCMGVTTMAPALTDAATQAIKLPESTPSPTDSVSTGRQADDQANKEGQKSVPSENVKKCMLKTSRSADLPTVSHLNGNSLRSIRSVDKQLPAFPKLQGAVGTLAVRGHIKKHIVIHKSLLQTLRLSGASLVFGKVTTTDPAMNRPPVSLDKEDGKYQGHDAQNRTHPYKQLDQTEGDRPGACNPQTAGNHLLPQKPGGVSMPSNIGLDTAGEVKPTPIVSSNHFHGSGAMNHRHLKSDVSNKVQGAFLPVASTSTMEGHEIDRTVTEQHDEAAKKQAQLERRLEFLKRRQRRLQSRQVEKHIRRELTSFISYHQQNLHTVTTPSSPGFQNSQDLNKELLSDGAKHMSTAALVSLVHKMQKQGAISQPAVQSKPMVTTVLNISDADCRDSRSVADRLSMNLHLAQTGLDSDATESSSGGETDGEDRPGSVGHHHVPSTPLTRRAEWKWLGERAAIAAKWTWLQAQVSDLEYRIRQQTEAYRLSRASKGPVVLAEPSSYTHNNNAAAVLSRTQPVVALRQGASTTVPQSLASAVSQGSRPVLPSEAQPHGRPSQLNSLHCQPFRHLSQQSGQLSQPNGQLSQPASLLTQPNNQFLQRNSQLCQQARQLFQPAKSSPSGIVGGVLPSSKSGSSHPMTIGLYPSGDASQKPSLPQNRRGGEENGCGGGDPTGVTSSFPSPADYSCAADPMCRAARCLPLKHALRKRQLVRTQREDVRDAPKASRPSTVKCQCQLVMTPCMLCNRKTGIQVQMIDPDVMSFQERVALMDPSYHPVLSFSEEVPLSVHFESLLRSSAGEWQSNAALRRPRAQQGQRLQKIKFPNHSEGRKGLLRKNQSSVIIQSAKIRNKYEHKAGRKLGPAQSLMLSNNRGLSGELKGFSHVPFSVGRGRGRGRGRRGQRGRRGRGYFRCDMDRLSSLSGVGNYASGVPYLREREVRRRRGESAYDINSIVIPRSMAAATRPEKLEYKEIPTPRWRCIKQGDEIADPEGKAGNPPAKTNGLIIANETNEEDDEIEDLSDESYMWRHNMCEVAEKRRFSTTVRKPHHHRRRRRRPRHTTLTHFLHPASPPSSPTTPVSMATQVAMDAGEAEEWDTVGDEGLQQSSALESMEANGSDPGCAGNVLDSRRDSASMCDLDGGSSSVDGADPALTSWPLRRFPLTDNEAEQLEKEELSVRDEEKTAPYTTNLRAVSRTIQNLRPHLSEAGGSQAGSSVSSSLPPSPLPSTSSASLADDWDIGDAEWTIDSDTAKKKAKNTKR